MDLDGKDPSDEENDGSEYDMAPAEVEQNFIQLDSDDELANTDFPSVPPDSVIPLTQARGSTGTGIGDPFVPTRIPPAQTRSSTRAVTRPPLLAPRSTTTSPTQARGLTHGSSTTFSSTQTRSSAGLNSLARSSTFSMSSTQTRSSTGTDTSRPLGPPTFSSVAALPQAKGSPPPSPQLPPTGSSISPRQVGVLSHSSSNTFSPTHTRSSAGSNSLARSSTFSTSSTQTRSSTGTDTSRPLGPPTFSSVAALPQAKGSPPPSPRLPPTGSSISPWQVGVLSSEPRGPPPISTASAQSLCVVGNS